MQLAHIELSDITPNDDNPRGIDIPTNDEKLAYLKDSIKAFGIMVPLVVTPRSEGGYTLIDGERRYWASKSLSLKKVPAYIIGSREKLSKKDILFRMFQIHHNREQWAPIQQCHALEGLYKSISAKSKIQEIEDPRAQTKAIAEEIVKNTGIESGTALTRVHFLRWPEEIKRRLYDKASEDGYWYICEIEAKIMIPAMTNYPEYFKQVPADEVRKGLFEKLEQHTVERSTEVRKIAPYFRQRVDRPAERRLLMNSLSTLYRDVESTYGEAQEELQQNFPDVTKADPPSAKRLLSYFVTLTGAIDDFDCGPLRKLDKKTIKTKADLRSNSESLMSQLSGLLKELEK